MVRCQKCNQRGQRFCRLQKLEPRPSPGSARNRFLASAIAGITHMRLRATTAARIRRIRNDTHPNNTTQKHKNMHIGTMRRAIPPLPGQQRTSRSDKAPLGKRRHDARWSPPPSITGGGSGRVAIGMARRICRRHGKVRHACDTNSHPAMPAYAAGGWGAGKAPKMLRLPAMPA